MNTLHSVHFLCTTLRSTSNTSRYCSMASLCSWHRCLNLPVGQLRHCPLLFQRALLIFIAHRLSASLLAVDSNCCHCFQEFGLFKLHKFWKIIWFVLINFTVLFVCTVLFSYHGRCHYLLVGHCLINIHYSQILWQFLQNCFLCFRASWPVKNFKVHKFRNIMWNLYL